MSIKKVLNNVKTNADLLSYIINVTPELKADIDLPVQRTRYCANRKIDYVK